MFLTRAGCRPLGMARFFERIELEQEQAPEGFIPPYLYAPPAVDSRIEVVRGLDEKLKPMKSPPRLDERFRAMQGRLAYLLAHKRSAISEVAPHDRTRTDPLLAEARGHRAAGDIDAALASLDAAEVLEPNDPRVSAERGEIFMAVGRPADATVAYRRAVHLDPNPPSLFLALSRAHRDAGNHRKAVFFAEQAVWRWGNEGHDAAPDRARTRTPDLPGDRAVRLRQRSRAQQRQRRERHRCAEAHHRARRRRRAAVLGRISPHHLPTANYLTVRWTDPSGKLVRDERPRRTQRVYILDSYDFEDAEPGDWTFQVLLADDVVLETTIRVTE